MSRPQARQGIQVELSYPRSIKSIQNSQNRKEPGLRSGWDFPLYTRKKVGFSYEAKATRVAGKKVRSIIKLNAETLLPGQPPH